jgi:hypothetical protein
MMPNASTDLSPFSALLSRLTAQARAAGFTDRKWAERASIRHETLSRLRRQDDCDFATLQALATAVGSRFELAQVRMPGTTVDGHFPAAVDRDYESALLALCAARSYDRGRWLALGPAFFMAGLAVLVASVAGMNRRELLDLAELLHPGASEVAVFQRWLERTPVAPTRFLPMLDAELRLEA